MDLYRINLNLLVALDVLLQEKSVTLAAKRLFITQAAMSNNLNQLRTLFNDPLLIREKNKMLLSTFAKDLQGTLQNVLTDVETIIASQQHFIPAETKRVFTIGMPDFIAAILLPRLMQVISKEAPNMQIKIAAIKHVEDERVFENENLDLLIAKTYPKAATINRTEILEDKVVVLLNKRHPLASKKKITLKDYLAYKHVAIKADNSNSLGIVDQALEKLKIKRDVSVALPFIIPIFKIIEYAPNLIASVTLATIQSYQKQQFAIKELPFELPKIYFYALWHKRHDNDKGHMWLRDKISEQMTK